MISSLLQLEDQCRGVFGLRKGLHLLNVNEVSFRCKICAGIKCGKKNSTENDRPFSTNYFGAVTVEFLKKYVSENIFIGNIY